MRKLTLSPGPAETSALLSGEGEYAGSERILGGLSAADACRAVAGCPHTIAALTAHLDFWQQWQLKVADDGEPDLAADFQHGRDDFPPVTEGEWEGLRARFLASHVELARVAEDPARLERVIAGKCNLGFMLVSHVSHNAYHLGQIALLRRMMGLWPPAPTA